MRYIYLIYFMYCLTSSLAAQPGFKRAIEEKDLLTWEMVKPYTTIDDAGINEVGTYVYYYLQQYLSGKSKLVFQATGNSTKYVFDNATNPIFTPGGGRCLFIMNDTLNDLTLATGARRQTAHVRNIQLIGQKKYWLVYQKQMAEQILVFENLFTKKAFRLNDVDKYHLDPTESFVILTRNKGRQISWLDLASGTENIIWTSKNSASVYSTVFDKLSQQLVFGVNDQGDNSVWLYNRAKKLTERKLINGISGIPSGKRIGNDISFSRDGSYIFFTLENPIIQKSSEEAVKISIWNFKDKLLKGEHPGRAFTVHWCVINIKSNKIVPVVEDGEKFLFSPLDLRDCMVIRKDVKSRYWEDNYHPSNHLIDEIVFLNDGHRIKIPFVENAREYTASPDGRSLFIWGGIKGKEKGYCMTLESGKFTFLTKELPAHLFESDSEETIHEAKVAGWIPGDNSVLIYDQYDIWKLNLNGHNPPVNMTGGYGRRNHVKFRFSYSDHKAVFNRDDQLLLTAFNWQNKNNGFYRIHLHKPGKLDSLSMKPWITDVSAEGLMPSNDFLSSHGFPPKKAKNKNIWLVFGKSAIDAPNFFLTDDLKKFVRITNYQPQKEVNWYTSELAEWNSKDGSLVKGVLFKPTDFDPNKKYPVIVSHYRMLSQLCNEYFPFKWTEDAHIEVPWFVSRGYLILLPDVYLTKGGSGPAALKVVESAVDWLSSKSFVDKTKIGLAGHSQGGFQANYIAANTNIFACILAGAGGADLLSSAFRSSNYISLLASSEERLGLPWDSDRWVQQSAIYHANKVNSPLLLFHCPNDGAVPFKFSVDFFTALWRLEKPVWLLEYPEGDHSTTNLRDSRDFTTRVTQFFDHYLKDAPAPIWMTRGVPAFKEGIETGLELDPEGSNQLPKNPFLD